MQLQQILAHAHPSGNRIDLFWVNPAPDLFPGVRVVRGKTDYPASPDAGVLVTEGVNLSYVENEAGEKVYNVVDQGLQGEIVYYYTFFPYRGSPPEYDIDPNNRTSAMATARYNMAGQMFDLLPQVYHRYDTVPPPADTPMSTEDKPKGQLQRFLDLPGGQFDQLFSYATALLDLYNLDKVDGRLLPLLAQWIGWQVDYRRQIDTQRNEIRAAPHIYKTTGIIPTVEATVKRMLGWESLTKEFFHNLVFSNDPERLNRYLAIKQAGGNWVLNDSPLSLDFAYEGRPSIVRDADGLWLFYHTERNSHWDIWYKRLKIFNIASNFLSDLQAGRVSLVLQQVFAEAGFMLSLEATIEKHGSQWKIVDAQHQEHYTVLASGNRLNIYHWSPSQPLTYRALLDKHPSAVQWGNQLWVFWDVYDEATGRWHLSYSVNNKNLWSAIRTFDDGIERRSPTALVDPENRLWLFWLEHENNRWQLKYRAYDTSTVPLNANNAQTLDNSTQPSGEYDLFAIVHPVNSQLWLFWARKTPDELSHWEIAFRFKADFDPNTTNWSSISVLPKSAPNYDDREPSAFVNQVGQIELFWSSTRDRSWSIWYAELTDPGTNTWSVSQQITTNVYSQRAPLPVQIGDNTLLIYGSNESIAYTSQLYRATETLDMRYAGSTTADTRNITKLTRRGLFEDFQTYTYDTGQNGIRGDLNWYARDTIGIYLTPNTEDPAMIEYNRNLIRNALRQFLPIQVRVVFIIPLVSREFIYTYDFPEANPQRRIGEVTFDSVLPETYGTVRDFYRDQAPGWRWFRAWAEDNIDHQTVDFDKTPPKNIDLRTRHIGLDEGE